ncbi:MAG: hypothetical protein J1F18_13200 [Lachnospiraceae bacterium]|nr:hypothetical protein [Lachnospiraceae bacterium]
MEIALWITFGFAWFFAFYISCCIISDWVKDILYWWKWRKQKRDKEEPFDWGKPDKAWEEQDETHQK